MPRDLFEETGITPTADAPTAAASGPRDLFAEAGVKLTPPVTMGPGLDRSVGVSAPEPTAEDFAKDDAAIAARKAAQQPMSTGRDIIRSIGSGLIKGGAAIPNTLGNLVDTAMTLPAYGLAWGLEKAGVVDPGFAEAVRKPLPPTRYEPGSWHMPGGTDGLEGAVAEAAGGEHIPQTRLGQAAENVTSFLPGAVGLGATSLSQIPGAALKYGLLPGLTSEAAGQATKGSAWEPVARIAGALAGGLPGAAWDWKAAAPKASINDAVAAMTPQELQQAQELVTAARMAGTNVTFPEAVAHVTNGRVNLMNMQRYIESTGNGQQIMAPFMADRGPGNAWAAGTEFNNIAPPVTNATEVAPRVQAAARAGVAATPEGQALSGAVTNAGPRITAEDAGNVIRPDLQQSYEALTQARSAVADPLYDAARTSQAAVDTDPLLQHINGRLAVTKGDIQAAIERARQNLFVGHAPDRSVEGLMESRKAINDQISAATRAGNNQLASELLDIRGRLDAALGAVPEVAAANGAFRTGSVPLEPFGETRAPGQILDRDQFNSRYTMPTERVAPTLEQGGASAARDFNQVAGQAGRDAYQNYLRTRLLDAATDATGNVSSASIRGALRDNTDLLRQYPDVARRLEAVAVARDGMAPVERSALGQLAAAENFPEQARVIFNPKPLPGSDMQVRSAVTTVARTDPDAARALVRMKLEQAFNEAGSNNPVANQGAGAKFAKALLSDPQEARNLEAAVTALPNGQQIWQGMRRLFDIFEAQGFRQGANSATEQNQRLTQAMREGGNAQAAATALSPNKWGAKALEWYQQLRFGKNTEQWARLFTDPDVAAELNRLRIYPANSRSAFDKAAEIVGRRLYAIEAAAGSKSRP